MILGKIKYVINKLIYFTVLFARYHETPESLLLYLTLLYLTCHKTREKTSLLCYNIILPISQYFISTNRKSNKIRTRKTL